MKRHFFSAFLLIAGYLSAHAIPAVVPIERNGVVLDSLNGEPIADVVITVRELPDTIGCCIETETTSTKTNSKGEFQLKLGCAADVIFMKAGYETVTLRWPQELAKGQACGCCPELRDVKLLRTAPGRR